MSLIENLSQAQAALRPFYNNSRTPYTLDTMHSLMKYLGNPQDRLRILHVAGTSGKTSTVYYCAALLKEAGFIVGMSVSPHVDTINERLQIDGAPMPEADFCQTLTEFLLLIADAPVQPSYFELLVAMAYWEFDRRGVDYAVIEVGLGGMLDGTNVVSRTDKICVITDIGLDHTEILGETVELIAAQKAGIIQPGNSVVMYAQDRSVVDTVQAAADLKRANLQVLPPSDVVVVPDLPLFQQRNLGLAAAAVNMAIMRDHSRSLSATALKVAARTVVPARLERFKVQNKIVIVDGSHNQQKIQTLLQSVMDLYPSKRLAVLCSFVSGNQDRWQGGLHELTAAQSHIIFTAFKAEQDLPRSSVDIEDLVTYCKQLGFEDYQTEPDPQKAYALLLERPEPLVIITGSFYALNHIRPQIKESV